MAKAGHGMGSDTTRGVQGVGDTPEDIMREDEIGNQRMGKNSLHGNDAEAVANQRQTMAGERASPPETEDFVERHKTGLRSDKVAPSKEELDKLARKD